MADNKRKAQEETKDEDSNKIVPVKKNKSIPEDPKPAISPAVKRPYSSSFSLFFAEDAIDGLALCIGRFLRDHIDQAGEHLEVEAKLGLLVDTQTRQRLYTGSYIEMPVSNNIPYRFESDMSVNQHRSFNQMLNKLVDSKKEIAYKHFKVVDTIYKRYQGKKIRMTRNKDSNEIIAVVCKEKIADLDIVMPRSKLDLRITVAREVPVERPPKEWEIDMERIKDRISYRHTLVQVDLTQVTSIGEHKLGETYEVEIELKNPKGLLVDKRKLDQNMPNGFYQQVTELLSTARLLSAKAAPY